MSLFVNTKYRSNKTELMDDFSFNGEVLKDTLDKLASINKWLGGNYVTINGLKKLLKGYPREQPITIVDLGCGGGDLLRDVARFGVQNGYSFRVIGVDANEETVKYARELSREYPEISFMHCNIYSDEFQLIEYDIVLTSLFLHHFNDQELEELLSSVLPKVTIGILVNDLHRHPIAYYLFRLLCLLISNKMVKEDGLTSILKGFKRQEMEMISLKLGVKYEIRWKWAFRYQWIIQNR
jgi:2-polyprenyl-3-methyl-5-hydroxy-6-metoxy-1,4-benzoquinol methylase